ncbi:MAG TPA: response regulator [Thermomicrobiaceae bacterium]|nr:response regulator [Thermomicrobiaceae bacterium]
MGTRAAPEWESANPAVPRLLVIDDEQRIVDFLTRGLAGIGFAVDQQCDPRAGLRAALEGGYDLVILDLLMPELDGRDLLAELMRAKPDQQVIVLSALGDTANKVRSLGLGEFPRTTSPSRSPSRSCWPGSKPGCGPARRASLFAGAR